MTEHIIVTEKQLFKLMKNKSILFAGNKKLKIYGTLQCISGRRMKKENRVFFTDVKEALSKGFRPCGHCLRMDFLKWKETIF